MSDENNAGDLESVKRRIAKLLAMATDGRGDANEAAIAAAMAERLMRKFQIDNAAVLMSELARGDAEMFASETVYGSLTPEVAAQNASAWSNWLVIKLAELHDCRARLAVTRDRTGASIKAFYFEGYREDAQLARYSFISIVAQMRAATGAHKNQMAGKREAEQFRRGYVMSVVALLDAAIASKRADMQAASASRELVVVKADAVARRFGETRTRSARSASVATPVTSSYIAGRTAGATCNVSARGIAGGASPVAIGSR